MAEIEEGVTDVDLKSRLRAIVQPASKPVRELTYEPDIGGYEAGTSVDRVGEVLGGKAARNEFGECLVIDRRYESDRWHGDVRISDCELASVEGLKLLEPGLAPFGSSAYGVHRSRNHRVERRRWNRCFPRRLRLL